MKGIEQHIKWSEQCGDPGCRVFFIGERVFRAYNESRRQETLDFLNSECYAELLKNGMVVRTWITNDVSIEGYSLIVEHEHLTFMPEEWFCFDMLKDALAFHFRVNEYCRKYGYGIRDIGYGNVTLKNGQFCFTDFGSFRRVENLNSRVYLYDGLPLAFLPIALYSHNNGNDYLANSLLVNFSKWRAAVCEPFNNNFIHDNLRPYLHPIISYYEIYWRQRYPHLYIKSRFSVKIVQMLNNIAKSICKRKPTDWQLIKIQNFYSDTKAAEALLKMEFPYSGESIHSIDEERIPSIIPNVILRCIENPIKRVVLWGNFKYQDLLILRQSIDSEIIVMSNDRVYTNNLYKKIRNDEAEIWVLCCNAMRGHDFRILSKLKSDLIVMQERVYEQVREFDHSDWAEKASYFATHLLVHELDNEEMLKTKIYNFWTLKESNDQYKLFANNAENTKG